MLLILYHTTYQPTLHVLNLRQSMPTTDTTATPDDPALLLMYTEYFYCICSGSLNGIKFERRPSGFIHNLVLYITGA